MTDAHHHLDGLLEAGTEMNNESELFKYFLNDEALDTTDFSKVPNASPPESSSDVFDSPDSSPLPPLSSSSDMFNDSVFQSQLNSGLSYYDQANLFENVVLSVKDDALGADIDDVTDLSNDTMKKRKMPNSSFTPKNSIVPLSRTTQQLPAQQPPATEEERLQKRQKRLIKNRESAQLSRLRKKLYIEDLEKKVCTLTSENEGLTKKIQSLTEELMVLRNTLKNAGITPSLPLSASGINTASLFKKPAMFNNKNGSAAGICLLIVLFSFGLVFNAQLREGGPMFPSSKRDPVPDVVPPSQRVLTSIKEEKSDDTTNLRDLIDIFPATAHSKLGPSSMGLEKEMEPAGKRREPEPSTVVVKNGLPDGGHPLKRIKSEPLDEDKQTKSLVPIKITPSGSAITTKEDFLSEQLSTEVRYVEPGNALVRTQNNGTELQSAGSTTSYIYCSDAQEIIVAQGNSDEPPTIALLLPAGVLNSTLIPVEHESDNTMIEVSCQVLNIHVWQVSSRDPTRV